VEVFVVVMAVALGFRTYFFQPYQIPTGSMQPTLYGITAVADYEPDWTDKMPVRWGKFLLTGSRYREIKAKTAGEWNGKWKPVDTFIAISIGGKTHKIHKDMSFLIEPGHLVRKGQVIAKGLQKQGDHIIVNRLITNFKRPQRGDIVVFSTHWIALEQVRDNSAYIKRLVGMPGETISVCKGRLLADGEVVNEPDVFQRQFEHPHYPGYEQGPLFENCQRTLTLGENEFLMMGDNTRSSLDGRYFGGVSGNNIIGIGFFVPWPFFNRGIYDDHAGLVR
jgi:signal peptidase I